MDEEKKDAKPDPETPAKEPPTMATTYAQPTNGQHNGTPAPTAKKTRRGHPIEPPTPSTAGEEIARLHARIDRLTASNDQIVKALGQIIANQNADRAPAPRKDTRPLDEFGFPLHQAQPAPRTDRPVTRPAQTRAAQTQAARSPSTYNDAPRTGKQLFKWAYDRQLVNEFMKIGKEEGFPARLIDWTDEQVNEAYAIQSEPDEPDQHANDDGPAY